MIFIDYPGFNLRIAEFAKKNNFRTFYYISPKIWAWKQSRAKKIKKFIDKMFVIFPFEIDFYKKFNFEAIYSGNPNVDVIERRKAENLNREQFLQKNNISDKKIIALLAGSRKQEVKRLLPEILEVTAYFEDYTFVVAGISSLNKEFYASYENYKNVKLVIDQTYNLLEHSEAAIVTSGTATLETALFNIPQVVCYKTEPLFYIIAKLILKIEYISLVNILLNKKSVEEVIQKNISERIKNELTKILSNPDHKQQMLNDYENLKKLRGEKGSPEKTAKIIVDSL